MNNVDINKLTSNRVSVGEKIYKYFNGYQYDDKVIPLCIRLPKLSGYTKLITCLFNRR